MDNILEMIYFLAGEKNKYQYRTLFLCCTFWIFANILPCSLPFFQSMPIVDVYSKDNKQLLKENIKLEYKYCDKDNYNIDIVQYDDFSIIFYFDFYCKRFLVDMLSISVFAGGSVASMLLQLIVNQVGRNYSLIISLLTLGLSFILVFLHISHYFIYLFFFLLQMFIIMFSYSSICNLAEIISKDLRIEFISLVNSCYSLCGFAFTIIFYYKISWQFALLGSFIYLSIISLLFMNMTVQTPRYYASVGNYVKFYSSIRFISKVNERWKFMKQILPVYKNEINMFNTPDSQKDLKDSLNIESYCSLEEGLLNDFDHDKSDEENIINITEICDELHKNMKTFYDQVDNKKEFKKIVNSGFNLSKNKNINPEDVSLLITKKILDENNRKALKVLIFRYFVEEDLKHEYDEFSDFKKLTTFTNYKMIFFSLNLSWFVITGMYFMSNNLIFNLNQDDIYINLIYFYSYELTAYLFTVFMSRYFDFNRKSILNFLYVVLIITTLVIIIQHSLISILIFRFALAGCHNLNFLISLEAYPTELRLTGFGINCNMGCFSAILFPLFFNTQINSKVLGVFILISIFSLFFLNRYVPETKNIVLENIAITDESNLPNISPNKMLRKRRTCSNIDLDQYFLKNI